MTQAAYDLNTKTKSSGQYRAPRVRVVRGRSGLDKLRQTVAALRSVLVAALILGLVVSLLYSQAIITELSGEIESARQELTQAQSTYDYLSGRMDDITSSTNNRFLRITDHMIKRAILKLRSIATEMECTCNLTIDFLLQFSLSVINFLI